MKILSIDIGIKNLACCLFEKPQGSELFNILKWEIVNLSQEDECKTCCFNNLDDKSKSKSKKVSKPKKVFKEPTIKENIICGRPAKFTKNEFRKLAGNKRVVTIKFNFNLGDLVIGHTIPDIDLNKAPNVLSANSVLKQGIDTILNLWKQNPGMNADALWNLLETPENFKMWMRIITMKGKGDIDQENSVLVENSGYLPELLPNKVKESIGKKLLFAGGDRPSSVRTINALKYAIPLQKTGILGASYANDTQSFTLVHRNLITNIRGLEALGSLSAGTKRGRGGGSRQRISKKHHKTNVNHTRKKRVVYRK